MDYYVELIHTVWSRLNDSDLKSSTYYEPQVDDNFGYLTVDHVRDAIELAFCAVIFGFLLETNRLSLCVGYVLEFWIKDRFKYVNDLAILGQHVNKKVPLVHIPALYCLYFSCFYLYIPSLVVMTRDYMQTILSFHWTNGSMKTKFAKAAIIGILWYSLFIWSFAPKAAIDVYYQELKVNHHLIGCHLQFIAIVFALMAVKEMIKFGRSGRHANQYYERELTVCKNIVFALDGSQHIRY